MVIVEEVFGIVKGDCPERSGGRFGGDLGCWERGSGPFAPASSMSRRSIRSGPLFSFGCDGCDGFLWFFAGSVFFTENFAPGSLRRDDP
jgi:hypothetical protein